MSTSKPIFHYLCAKSKICSQFDQTLVKISETDNSILTFILYPLKNILNHFLTSILPFKHIFLVYCHLFIIIYNFIIIYSFLNLLFIIFISSYFFVELIKRGKIDKTLFLFVKIIFVKFNNKVFEC